MAVHLVRHVGDEQALRPAEQRLALGAVGQQQQAAVAVAAGVEVEAGEVLAAGGRAEEALELELAEPQPAANATTGTTSAAITPRRSDSALNDLFITPSLLIALTDDLPDRQRGVSGVPGSVVD